jgi:hypothetical protein
MLNQITTTGIINQPQQPAFLGGHARFFGGFPRFRVPLRETALPIESAASTRPGPDELRQTL